jgi:hypothetical protein
MKKLLVLLVAATLSAQAAQIRFALSPPGSDLGVGLSPSNEVPAVTNSTGSGNIVGPGIVFDTDTSILHLSVGYGSAEGFTDLTGVPFAMHIHSPAPPGHEANVLTNLTGFNVPAADPTKGGLIQGSLDYPTNSVADLLAGLAYINLHTPLNPGGEIRGQLIPINEPPTIICAANSTNECGTATTVTAMVSGPPGATLTVVWSLNGVGVQTNSLPPGPTGGGDVSFTGVLPLGANVLTVTVMDLFGNSASCSTLVTVVDTTPPVIGVVSADPNVLWPPNHKMIAVKVHAEVTDTCGPATWKILHVSSNEAENAKGSGHTSTDWKITGDHTLTLRAERLGKGSGRVYTITIQASDVSGNTAQKTVTVTVPHDQSKAPPKPPKPAPHGHAKKK